MKHRRSKAALSKQLATKRDLQRVRDDILRAIVTSDPHNVRLVTKPHLADVEAAE